MEGRDTEIKRRVSGRHLQAWRCADSLTFPEWPIVPGLPPFEKFKSAQIQETLLRGDEDTSPSPSVRPSAGVPLCHVQASTLINPTFLRYPTWWERSTPAQPSSWRPRGGGDSHRRARLPPPPCSLSHAAYAGVVVANWLGGGDGLTLSSLFKFSLLLSNLSWLIEVDGGDPGGG